MLPRRNDILARLRAIGDEQRSAARGGSDKWPQINEDDHGEADDLLLELIADPEITEAYNRIGKWYS